MEQLYDFGFQHCPSLLTSLSRADIRRLGSS
ncbi:hypothetical protein J008_00739 [Cryptococcus neoformans]|nr:hypothetical protein J008_00739 [Cryptococcus neoformans var. grubii]